MVAAARAGIGRVMLPARNRKDYEDIPDEVRKAIEFIWLDTLDEAVAAALEPGARASDKPVAAASSA